MALDERLKSPEPMIGLKGPDWVSNNDVALESVDRLKSLRKVVAVVGCDGSGKTRLVADLVTHLREKQATERRYMGLISGETGDKIKNLPLIGIVLERYLAAKVRRAQDMERKVPGLPTAIVMYLFSLWRAAHLRRLINRAGSGVLVVAERYPQAQIPGFHYDGPGLAVDRSSNRFVRKLAAREQSMYDWMAGHRPAMVIRLTIDAETAFARKRDHPLSELKDKAEKMRQIDYNGARIVEVDSRMPYARVLATALQWIDTVMLQQREEPTVCPSSFPSEPSPSVARRQRSKPVAEGLTMPAYEGAQQC